ncbi:MAG: 7-carboxy-7-deazaguanine synthase QueE [Bacteroidales bacterium]|nr:7-carboxy-7-deazaguanine synthase QueE [Bacteroidales bacterium]MCF8457294.1 7-carboxy-7-deazaguanine synthase QueE [Bacteroidales bacterium]
MLKSTQKIRLVKNGIFPITKNLKGEALPGLPATGQNFPGTFQGEGKLLGVPVLFVRMAGCNLRCVWYMPDGTVSPCDTPLSSFDLRGSEYWLVGDVVETLAQNLGLIRHVVVSGGEPLLQKEALRELCQLLKSKLGVHITIETNATIYDDELAKYVDLFSLSPKLKSSVPDIAKMEKLNLSGFENFSLLHEKRRMNIEVIQKFFDLRKNTNLPNFDLQLKFVITSEEEEAEVKRILRRMIGWKVDDVVLMPVGLNTKELVVSTQICWTMAVRNGWRFSPRLHIDLFGDKQGV